MIMIIIIIIIMIMIMMVTCVLVWTRHFTKIRAGFAAIYSDFTGRPRHTWGVVEEYDIYETSRNQSKPVVNGLHYPPVI
jgi:flagellar basal body-associated protein FliL